MNSLTRPIIRSVIKWKRKHNLFSKPQPKVRATIFYATVSDRDFYEVLGLPRHAKDDDIKKSFIRLAKLYHPDVNKSPEAQQRFVEVNTAYHTLMDPQKRASYDYQLKQKTQTSSRSTRAGPGQTNQYYYHEYKNEQRKNEERRRAQQERHRQQEEEDARRQREYQQRYQQEQNEEDQMRRETYEQRYRQFQRQFDDLMNNMKKKQQDYAKRDTAKAQEEFFKSKYSGSVRGSAYQQAVYGNLAEYYGIKGLPDFMKWYHVQYGNLTREFSEQLVELRRKTRIDENRNPLSADPFLFPNLVKIVDYGYFGRGGYGGFFNEKERLANYFMKPNGKFYPFLMQNKVRHAYDEYEFPPFVSIRESIQPQRRNITMHVYSESEAFLGSLQESFISDKAGSILKWFYEDNLLGKARGFIDSKTNTEKIIIEDTNSKRIAKIEEAKEHSSAMDIIRSIFRHHYIIYDGNERIVGRVVKERNFFKQQIGFYDVRGDIMAAAELSTGPAGGDVFDVDIADENRILPIVFNFVLAYHTIGVRRRNETLLAKLNKAGKTLVSWLTDPEKKNRRS